MCPVLEITSWFACDNNRSTLFQVLCCLSTKYLEEDQQTWHLESELQFCGLVEFEVWQNGHSPPIVLGYSYVSYVRQQTRCGWLKSLREIQGTRRTKRERRFLGDFPCILPKKGDLPKTCRKWGPLGPLRGLTEDLRKALQRQLR